MKKLNLNNVKSMVIEPITIQFNDDKEHKNESIYTVSYFTTTFKNVVDDVQQMSFDDFVKKHENIIFFYGSHKENVLNKLENEKHIFIYVTVQILFDDGSEIIHNVQYGKNTMDVVDSYVLSDDSLNSYADKFMGDLTADVQPIDLFFQFIKEM